MLKKHFHQILLLFASLLGVQLYAVQSNGSDTHSANRDTSALAENDNRKDLNALQKKKQKLEKTLEQHYKKDDINTLLTMGNLCDVLYELGDYPSAKTYYEKALKIQKKHYGADNIIIAITMANLGNLHDQLGEYVSAKPYLEKVVKVYEQHYGDSDIITASTMANLGSVLYNLGDYASAKTYYEKVLATLVSHYGAHYPEIECVKHNLATVEVHIASKSNQQQSKPALKMPLNEEKENVANKNNEVFDLGWHLVSKPE